MSITVIAVDVMGNRWAGRPKRRPSSARGAGAPGRDDGRPGRPAHPRRERDTLGAAPRVARAPPLDYARGKQSVIAWVYQTLANIGRVR